MEESSAPNPQPNEFFIPDTHAYAFTNIEICTAAEFLMTKLEPVSFEQLDRDDRVCVICQEEFCISSSVKRSHPPVKTVCGHIFGKRCIIKWLDPLCFWGPSQNDTYQLVPDDIGKTTCPMCRHGFFPQSPIEPMELLAHRLSFWDNAYASAGVARSATEERSRRLLWDYVTYCRSIDEHILDPELELLLDEDAQELLSDFAKLLKETRSLTAEQERLRTRLERIGRKDLAQCWFYRGAYIFNIDADDNERSVFTYPPGYQRCRGGF